MKPKLYKTLSEAPIVKRIGRVPFKPVAIAVASLSLIGVLGKGAPYIWSLPEKQIKEIQNNLPVKERLTAKEKAELVDKSRSTLISGIGTLATIVGGFVLIVNVYLAIKKLEQDADKNKVDKDLAESRLISERFSKAIEQIGNDDSIHIRLGGIYSLEKIAKDSPGDHWTVMEVLTAFIREKSPSMTSEFSKQLLKALPNPNSSLDVQAALTVISRSEVETGEELNLSSTNIIGAVLKGANLTHVNLSYAQLSKVDLFLADLNYADLSHAKISDCNLSFTRMFEANLSNCELRHVELLGKVNLQGANLINAQLYDVNLICANLRTANLPGVDLTGTRLMGANLINANLSNANLSGLDLRDTDLYNADLSETNLSDTDLRHALNITEAQVSSGLLCNTKLPKGMNLDPNRDCECEKITGLPF